MAQFTEVAPYSSQNSSVYLRGHGIEQDVTPFQCLPCNHTIASSSSRLCDNQALSYLVTILPALCIATLDLVSHSLSKVTIYATCGPETGRILGHIPQLENYAIEEMPSMDREGSRDRDMVLRHQHSFSESVSSRSSVPMYGRQDSRASFCTNRVLL